MPESGPFTNQPSGSAGEVFQFLIENGQEAVLLMGLEGQISYASSNLKAVLGFSAAEFVGTHFLEHVHPEDKDYLAVLFGTVLENPRKLVTATVRALHKDGKYRWVEGRAENLSGVAPINAIVCNVRDRTPEVLARNELSASESLHRSVLEALTAGLVRVNIEGVIVDTNAQALQMFQLRVDDVIGKHCTEFADRTVYPDLRPYPPERYPATTCLRTGERVPGETIGFRKNDGSILWATFAAAPWINPSTGRQEGAVETFVDVQALMEMQQALRVSQERFEIVQRATNDAVWDLDISAGQICWNQNVRLLFGYDPDGPISSLNFYVSCVHSEDRDLILRSFMAAIEEGQQSWSAEYRLRKTDGTYAYILNRCHMLRDGTGKVTRAVGAVMDVTASKQAAEQLARSQEMLRQAQKMEALGQMAGGVAHDFNNILTVIEGHAELLKREFLSTDGQESIKEIVSSVQRASALTRQLLTFSRKSIVNAEVLDLNEVVHTLGRMLGRLLGEHISLEISTGAPPPRVRADRGLIEQVIMNLAINARDAMPEGGRLEIITSVAEVPEKLRGCGKGSAWAQVIVRDTGCGIPRENLGKIFEPFFTTKDVGKGTGLGLASVYGILQQHEGNVEVESLVGKGTTFTLYFPIVHEEQPAPGLTRFRAISHGNETILLVEDEPALLNLAAMILERFGYKVVQAASGAQALKVWEERKSEIDLLVTDMVMPDKISGKTLGLTLLQEKPGLRVIFASGYSQEMLDTDFVTASGGLFLAKPYSPEQLLSTVRRALDS